MSSTTFVNGTTLTDAGWFNDVNDAIYQETPLGYGGTAGGTADALTLSPSPAISAYVTGNQFTFKAASANTGAATVAVSGLAAKAIQNNGSALTAGQIESGKWYVIVYDGTAFQLTKVAITSFTGGTLTSDLTMSGASIVEAEGAAVASASSCNIWATDGNTVHITGTTTINDFATAPQAGAWMKVIFDGALTLTQSGNLNLNGGGANITTAADDMAFVYADTTTQMDVFVVRKSGAAVVASGITLGTEQASTSGTSIDFTGIPSGVKRIMVMLDQVSSNGTSPFLIQIGDSGGVETSSYVSYSGTRGGESTNTAGFLVNRATAAATNTFTGIYALTLQNASSFKWNGMGIITESVQNTPHFGSGVKSLSAELDRVRITTVGGTDTFDAGAINIQYES